MTHQDFESIAALEAIGAATPDEERDLSAHLQACADCRQARQEYGEAAAVLAMSLAPVRPPSEVRARLLDSVDDDESDEGVVVRDRRFSPWWLATAATLFLALWCWREFGIRVTREKVRSQDAEIHELAAQNDRLQQQRDKLAAAMAAVASSETRTIALAGQQMSPSASAKVFLDPSARRAVVFFYNLPANPQDKSYQLWIIRANEPKPQSAGVFDVTNGSATITIDNLPVSTEMKALAVTMEPRGGVEAPTNTNFYLMGNS